MAKMIGLRKIHSYGNEFKVTALTQLFWLAPLVTTVVRPKKMKGFV
jgi:hypothetical protein